MNADENFGIGLIGVHLRLSAAHQRPPALQYKSNLLLGLAMALVAALASAAEFELAGQILPEAQASVSLHGASAPFESATLSDSHGRFRFHKLPQGTYTVAVFEPGRGEARLTVEVGAGVADSTGRVSVTLRFDEASFEADHARRRRSMVSAHDLAIP